MSKSFWRDSLWPVSACGAPLFVFRILWQQLPLAPHWLLRGFQFPRLFAQSKFMTASTTKRQCAVSQNSSTVPSDRCCLDTDSSSAVSSVQMVLSCCVSLMSFISYLKTQVSYFLVWFSCFSFWFISHCVRLLCWGIGHTISPFAHSNANDVDKFSCPSRIRNRPSNQEVSNRTNFAIKV